MSEKKERPSGATLRFERHLRHPPEKVWRALTEGPELERWFPALVEGEREVGAPLSFVTEEGVAEGRITELDPPRVLAYTWGDETLRWELFPAVGGCLLVLTTTARGNRQWDACVERTRNALGGRVPVARAA